MVAQAEVTVTAIYGEQIRSTTALVGGIMGDAIAQTGLPLEQPCAGRGTCGKCKILVEAGAAPPDEVEQAHLTEGELRLNNRLACRARIASDAQVLLLLSSFLPPLGSLPPTPRRARGRFAALRSLAGGDP